MQTLSSLKEEAIEDKVVRVGGWGVGAPEGSIVPTLNFSWPWEDRLPECWVEAGSHLSSPHPSPGG